MRGLKIIAALPLGAGPVGACRGLGRAIGATGFG